MKRLFIKIIKTDKFVLLPILVSLVSITLMIAFMLISYNQLPEKMPLLYSLSWGDDQLVSKAQFFALPSVVGLISLTNAFLAWHLNLQNQLILKRILMLSLLLVNLISVITAFKIYSIFI